MPFGPANGPVIFIAFNRDLDSTWKKLACSHKMIIDDTQNSTLIVDNIFSWSKTVDDFIKYLSYQLFASHKTYHYHSRRASSVPIDWNLLATMSAAMETVLQCLNTLSWSTGRISLLLMILPLPLVSSFFTLCTSLA